MSGPGGISSGADGANANPGSAPTPAAPGAPGPIRTVYLGTSWFAAEVLRRLVDADRAPALVVTRPDRPAGRGRRLTPPPVAEAAIGLALNLIQPERLDQPVVERIAAVEPSLIVVCAYGALIREPLLSLRPMINVHPSLLPRWRGAAPVERALMAGDAETGVSIMRVTSGLDGGPVALREREPIGPDDTYGTLAPRLVDLGARLLLRAVELGPDGLSFVEQDERLATYAEKVTAADRNLDPTAPARERHDRVRALSPHIGARRRESDGSLLGIRRTRLTDGGELELVEVQPAGGRPMSYADYARGRGGA